MPSNKQKLNFEITKNVFFYFCYLYKFHNSYFVFFVNFLFICYLVFTYILSVYLYIGTNLWNIVSMLMISGWFDSPPKKIIHWARLIPLDLFPNNPEHLRRQCALPFSLGTTFIYTHNTQSYLYIRIDTYNYWKLPC